jgi:hypothetical protein
MSQQMKSIYPKVIAGQNLIRLSNGTFYIGTSRKGHNFPDSEQFRFLQYCNGDRDLNQISTIIGTQISSLYNYLDVGLKQGYLQSITPSAKLTNIKGAVGNFGRSIENQQDQTLTRRQVEIDFISAQSLDGPQTLQNRSTKVILIFGSNKFAFALLAALHASGFNNARVIGSFGKDSGQIKAEDISGGVIQPADVGSTLAQLSKRVLREHQLPHLGARDRFDHAEPELIIAMQPIPADYQQRWLSESTPHLVIGPIIDNQIDIGPLIIPGKSPCLRCIDLSAASNAIAPEIAMLKYLNQVDALPAAVLSLVVGYAAIAAANFLDQARQSANLLSNSALRVNLSQICKQSHIFWQANPMCGCGADLGEYAGANL